MSHKALAQVAVDAAKRSGIHERQVYTMAEAPGSLPLRSIEYVERFYGFAARTFALLTRTFLPWFAHMKHRQLIAEDLPFPDLPRINPHDVVTLPFSSGTTARPKVHARYCSSISCAFSRMGE